MADNNRQGSVVVCSALPNAIIFPLSDGRRVKINGKPLSHIVNAEGLGIASTRYGSTIVDSATWERVKREHHDSPFFKKTANVIFEEGSQARADDRAKEQSKNLVTGLEQMDPKKTRTSDARKTRDN